MLYLKSDEAYITYLIRRKYKTMSKSFLNGYTNYTTPSEVQKSVIEDSKLGNVGTSVTVTVSWSWSVTVSWTVG